jgi:dihydrofolate reductase
MRKVIASQLITLDGMFEAPNKEFVPPPWNDELDSYGVEMLTHECDTIIYGRVCYEMNRGFWEQAPEAAKLPVAPLMSSTPKLVFSRTLPDNPGWNARVIRDRVAETVMELKRAPGKDLVMYGSANLMETFVQHDLIDEYVFMVNPLIMGGGAPLFRGGHARQPMKLVWSRPLANGVLLLRYARDRAATA